MHIADNTCKIISRLNVTHVHSVSSNMTDLDVAQSTHNVRKRGYEMMETMLNLYLRISKIMNNFF